MSNVIITWKYSFYMTLEETVWTYVAVQMEIMLFTSLYSRSISCLFVRTQLSARVYYVKCDYNMELYDLLEDTDWSYLALQHGS